MLEEVRSPSRLLLLRPKGFSQFMVYKIENFNKPKFLWLIRGDNFFHALAQAIEKFHLDAVNST